MCKKSISKNMHEYLADHIIRLEERKSALIEEHYRNKTVNIQIPTGTLHYIIKRITYIDYEKDTTW